VEHVVGISKVLIWFLLSKCNLRCKYCYYSIAQREERELNTNTVLRIAEKAKEVGVFLVHLSGGELRALVLKVQSKENIEVFD
jgi:MoaA/NifB/PqqE/SkfB family radical SAM enzyme